MKRLFTWAGIVLALGLPVSAQAHRAWMLPSATVLSGEDLWITVDAAVSNDLFFFEHVPLRLDGLMVSAPDGSPVQPANVSTGKFRSTFDVHLTQSGTYKLAVVTDGLFARYEENGQMRRWRGTAETLAKEVPADAKNLQLTQSQSRMEVFVTAGQPTETVLKPTGSGLELVATTHPNDLFVGETSRFALLLDGKPAAGVAVAIIPGGIRYRDRLKEISVTTDQQGAFTVVWPEPGMYWLNASIQDGKASVERARRRASYTATLEVLPQ